MNAVHRTIKTWHLRRLTVLALLFAVMLIPTKRVSAQRVQTLRQKLSRQVSVTWQGQELGTAIERLTDISQIPYWLDRRVDPQLSVTTQFENLSLQAALEHITQQRALDCVQLKKIVYVGPEQTALKIKSLIRQAHEQLSKAPRKTKQRWLRAKEVSWPRLSEPRALAEAWLTAIDVQLIHGERIPHDLWAEKVLPKMATVDRLVLLLAGFDLVCEISADGGSCVIVEVGDVKVVEGGGDGARPLKRARLRPGGEKEASRRQAGEGATRQVFSLRLENQPVEKVLQHFATQLKLEIVWPADVELRQRLVSCEVRNVDLDALLAAVLKSADLQHQRDGLRITIQNR